MQEMTVVSLSDAASIATLILFGIYFVGRTITIFRQRTLYYDEVIIKDCRFPSGEHQVVDTVVLEEDAINSYILTSKQGIFSLSVYKIEYDEDLNVIGRQKIAEYSFLNVGQSLDIQSTIPEIIPRYEIEYYTFDYKKVSIRLIDNLKNGVLSEIVQPKHTIKSVLYYLFR